jgi:hypothetical protein
MAFRTDVTGDTGCKCQQGHEDTNAPKGAWVTTPQGVRFIEGKEDRLGAALARQAQEAKSDHQEGPPRTERTATRR